MGKCAAETIARNRPPLAPRVGRGVAEHHPRDFRLSGRLWIGLRILRRRLGHLDRPHLAAMVVRKLIRDHQGPEDVVGGAVAQRPATSVLRLEEVRGHEVVQTEVPVGQAGVIARCVVVAVQRDAVALHPDADLCARTPAALPQQRGERAV